MTGLTLIQGWHGMALAFATVELPMIVGLARTRAQFRQYLISPLATLPLIGIAGGAATLSGPLLAYCGFASHGLAPSAVGAGLGAVLGYFGGVSLAQPADENERHQRGSFVSDRPKVRRASSRANELTAEVTLAGIAVPQLDETKHFKVIGTTGTGKSTAIQEIMARALARGDRAVIADPDGGYLARFYRPDRGDIVLNPFDPRSVKWDLFGEIKSAHDVEQLARSLIPDYDGQDRSWRSYARTYFAAVAGQAHEAGIKDVGELYRLLVIADSNELRSLMRGTPAQPFLEEHNGRMFDSIRSVTSSAIGALTYIDQQKAEAFSVREWVKGRAPGVLFIPYKAGQIAALRSTVSAWMRLAIFETMEHDELRSFPNDANSRLWFVVDELDALGQIDGLKDALARLRKFGGRCVLGFQSIAQVSSTYGQGDAHTIVENCGNTLILRCSASEGGGTARFASQLIGDREVMRTTVSKSRRTTDLFGSITHSEHISTEPAVLPSQVEQLPDLAGYLKYASDPQWQRVRLDATNAWRQLQSQNSVSAETSAGRPHDCTKWRTTSDWDRANQVHE